MDKISRRKPRLRGYSFSFVAIVLVALVSASAYAFDQDFFFFIPGNLVVSRSVYDNNPNNVSVGETLPPGCTSGCGVATNNGTYPQVFNNDVVDGSFGITSKIFLDQITPFGFRIGSLEVPNNAQFRFPFERDQSQRDQMVTSFSSKSELALNLSTDHRSLTFMGYVAPIDALDVSNSNTPGVVDPTNSVSATNFRAVAQVDALGSFRFTETNAYSGNNGRAAIFNDDADAYYTAGNAGNGSNPQPDGIILGAGAQFIAPAALSLFEQDPGTPTPLASFSITELPANKKPDKIGKDDNFRGLTIFNNVVYYTKGSGSNGIDTVYFVDTTGTACPQGVGLPAAGAMLPTAPLSYVAANLQTTGLPNNMCVLSGFNTTLAKTSTTVFPFGLWFANANTLYVADEGDGNFADAATQATAGLQKWIFNSATSTWQLAYVLQNELGLGVPYTVPGYPTGTNPVTGLPWAPETDGLRNLTGILHHDGTATIYAITSTVSGNGDQGADPNKLVAITDNLSATTPLPSESFHTMRSAGFGEVLRGVSLTPDFF
jgi:hypothetical protein